jgi:hypothetical protein
LAYLGGSTECSDSVGSQNGQPNFLEIENRGGAKPHFFVKPHHSIVIAAAYLLMPIRSKDQGGAGDTEGTIFGRVEDDVRGGKRVVVSDDLGTLNLDYLSIVSQCKKTLNLSLFSLQSFLYKLSVFSSVGLDLRSGKVHHDDRHSSSCSVSDCMQTI